MKNKLLPLCVVASFPFVLSCGDSDDGSGVSGDTLVKDATSEELEKVCRWTVREMAGLEKDVGVRQACTFGLAPISESVDQCKELVDECVDYANEAEEEEEEDEDPCEDYELPDLAAGCNGITLADYELCVETIASRAEKLFKSASCNDPGEELDPESLSDDLPTACTVIINKCPSILPTFIEEEEEEEEELSEE
jgi:hypothetical protein